MANFDLRLATTTDVALLKGLVDATPQGSDMVINFERGANFFDGTQVVTSSPEVWLYCDTKKQRLAGAFSIGTRPVYVNGKKRRIRYANDLRIHSDYRGSRGLLRIANQVKKRLGEREWMQTVILSDNHASLSTIGSSRAGMPAYHPFGEINTHMIYIKSSKPALDMGLTIRQAGSGDLQQMQTFFEGEAPKKQLYPHYDFSAMVEGNAYYKNLSIEDYFLAFDNKDLVGICGTWNQKEFKQTRFLAYKGKMRWLRYFNNGYSRCFGGIQLPRPGETLDYVLLHSILVKENQVDIFRALLRYVYNGYVNKPDGVIVSGLYDQDPLHDAYRDYRKESLRSRHFLVSYGDDPGKQLDKSRPLYIEVARL
ncbi:hypothetical protein FKG94_27125 [Exilibacterium tricleocarpae]|uniref:N-acetyltransferase domain-containing protein n=1 Tax=Exilibacterium tricleocarpae TaxID=2591008 RepID=A0A545SNH6_9GAMM|nr:hypothetical protein [Exilibacterium tricleocarpae]TQV66507.1 hypothetical protein FKG94_27125 [Exilibacterium tricleocarpae]